MKFVEPIEGQSSKRTKQPVKRKQMAKQKTKQPQKLKPEVRLEYITKISNMSASRRLMFYLVNNYKNPVELTSDAMAKVCLGKEGVDFAALAKRGQSEGNCPSTVNFEVPPRCISFIIAGDRNTYKTHYRGICRLPVSCIFGECLPL
jgi:hypothetical protein